MSSLIQALLSRRMVVCLLTGFSSGLPLYVGRQLMPAWLDVSGVDLKTIGVFGLLSLPYTLKFLWAPLLDRYTLPGLGRRRGWALLIQGLLLAALGAFSAFDPGTGLGVIATLTAVVAFLSASQDIVLDAWRRELLPDENRARKQSLRHGYRVLSFPARSPCFSPSDPLVGVHRRRCLHDRRHRRNGTVAQPRRRRTAPHPRPGGVGAIAKLCGRGAGAFTIWPSCSSTNWATPWRRHS